MTATARPPDPTADAFVRTLLRSRLLDRAALDAALAGSPRLSYPRARDVADDLIAAGRLTHYQADKLLRGLWQGLVLGPYHVLAPLGRGGMGTVYLARDVRIGGATPDAETAGRSPLVALKVLPPQKARESGHHLARFRRETDLGRRLAHPNVTRTLDDGFEEGVHFIAMEYVPGESLKRVVSAGGPLPVGPAARLFVDVLAGLAHAHERGLIHRDLKPSNVMVTPDGRAKILDLGLALLVDEVLPADRSVVGGAGYILGTMDYIAPEQAADATDVGPWSDLYAAGCSLYFTLTGAPPFPGGTARQKMRWHQNEAPPPLRSLNPSVPAEFAYLVEKLLAKSPADRPASAADVRAKLLPWAEAADAPVAIVVHGPRSAGEAVASVDSPDFDPSLWVAPARPPVVLSLDDSSVAPTRRRWLLLAVAVFVSLLAAAVVFLSRGP